MPIKNKIAPTTFTTSAQKTIRGAQNSTLDTLVASLEKMTNVPFENTKNPSIKKAILSDGSTLIAASFMKEDKQIIAMIDHKNVPDCNDRKKIQSQWKKHLSDLF